MRDLYDLHDLYDLVHVTGLESLYFWIAFERASSVGSVHIDRNIDRDLCDVCNYWNPNPDIAICQQSNSYYGGP